MLAAILAFIAWRRQRARALIAASSFAEAELRLTAGDEYRAVIFRLYAALDALTRKMGATVHESHTPREVALALNSVVPVPQNELKQLIELFERARYNDAPLHSSQRDDAVRCLHHIRTRLLHSPHEETS
jgi:hypothetical protein